MNQPNLHMVRDTMNRRYVINVNNIDYYTLNAYNTNPNVCRLYIAYPHNVVDIEITHTEANKFESYMKAWM